MVGEMITEMLTAKDIQQMLQIDRSTVYRMADDGRLPAVKVGRQWRFPTNQMENWLQERGTAYPHKGRAATILSPQSEKIDLNTNLPIASIQLMQDAFADALGIMVIITDMDGNPITEFSNPCGLFAELSDVPKLWQKCMRHWQEMAATLSLEPKFMQSYLGLLCARGFIRVGAELKGMVFIGGVAPQKWPLTEAEIEEIATDLNIQPERITDHICEVYQFDRSKRTEMLSFTQRIANIVSHILHERKTFLNI